VWKMVRVGDSPPERDQTVARSRTFASTVASDKAAVTLLRVRDDRACTSYLIAPEGSRSPQVLAAAVGARPERVDDIPGLPGPVRAWASATPAPEASRNTQSGGDPSEVALALSRLMPADSFVAVCLRPPSRGETARSRRWFRHRNSGAVTHYSGEPEVLVASVVAGAGSRAEATGLIRQLVAALPGFDVEVSAQVAGTAGVAAGTFAFGATGGIALAEVAGRTVDGVGLSVAGAAVAAGFLSGRLPVPGGRFARRVAAADMAGLPSPPSRRLPVRGPGVRRLADGTQRSTPGGYPLDRRSFMVGPAMCVGVVTPHTGAGDDVAGTRDRPVPAALAAPVGPMVGFGGEHGERVHLDASHAYGGVGLIGIPGTGKTALAEALWGWACLERVRPSGRPGCPGRSNTLVGFAANGDGADGLADWAAAVGDRVLVCELADPSTAAVDFFAGPGGPAQRAEAFVDMMAYAWDADDIRGRSREALTTMFAAALSFDLRAAWATLGVSAEPDPVLTAHTLLGGSLSVSMA